MTSGSGYLQCPSHLTCVWRAGARGRPCSSCNGCRKPLHTSADALIPITMSFRAVLATSPTMPGAARAGVEVERTPCDSAVSWHVRAYMHQVSRVCRPSQTAAPMYSGAYAADSSMRNSGEHGSLCTYVAAAAAAAEAACLAN